MLRSMCASRFAVPLQMMCRDREMNPVIDYDTIAATILTMLGQRQPGSSICPSEAARRLAGSNDDWRALMPHIRAVALDLARAGRIRVLQKGSEVELATLKGPYRLARHDP